jgi:hypothetical protein
MLKMTKKLAFQSVLSQLCQARPKPISGLGTPRPGTVKAAPLAPSAKYRRGMPSSPILHACRNTAAMGSSVWSMLSLRETVKHPVATGGDQVFLAAAARHMRGVPRTHLVAVVGALSIDMAEHDFAILTACVIVAGQV